MKNVPMRYPASAAEETAMPVMLTAVNAALPNTRLNPKSAVVRSKKALAAVKPRKWTPLGTIMKFMAVAVRPIAVMAPSFPIHQAANVSTEKPIRSQRKGIPVSLKNVGEKMEFNTPQRPAHIAIAANSRLLKYVKDKPTW